MALSINFALAQSFADDWQNAVTAGANLLSSGDLVLHHTTQDVNLDRWNQFYRSTDNGQTWAHRSELAGWPLINHVRMLNLPTDVLLFPRANINTNEVDIYRSVNAAASWSIAATFPIGGIPDALIHAGAAVSHNRSSAIIGGVFARPDPQGYKAQLIYSTDAGQSWTDQPPVDIGSTGAICSILANASGGVLLAGFDTAGFYKSDDRGETWTATGAMSEPSPTAQTKARAAACLTPTDWIAGGSLSSTGDPYYPWLFWTDDAGATWNHVPASAIENWPNADGPLQIVEIRRLSRDAAIMGLGRSTLATTVPWRYTLDRGQTWVEPTTTGESWNNRNPTASGRIAVAPNGSIIAPVDVRNPELELELYLGTISC